jgi:hypothetical protein
MNSSLLEKGYEVPKVTGQIANEGQFFIATFAIFAVEDSLRVQVLV